MSEGSDNDDVLVEVFTQNWVHARFVEKQKYWYGSIYSAIVAGSLVLFNSDDFRDVQGQSVFGYNIPLFQITVISFLFILTLVGIVIIVKTGLVFYTHALQSLKIADKWDLDGQDPKIYGTALYSIAGEDHSLLLGVGPWYLGLYLLVLSGLVGGVLLTFSDIFDFITPTLAIVISGFVFALSFTFVLIWNKIQFIKIRHRLGVHNLIGYDEKEDTLSFPTVSELTNIFHRWAMIKNITAIKSKIDRERDSRMKPIDDRILKHMLHEGNLTPNAVEAFGVTMSENAKKRLKILEEYGLTEQVSSDLYRLTDDGHAYINTHVNDSETDSNQ